MGSVRTRGVIDTSGPFCALAVAIEQNCTSKTITARRVVLRGISKPFRRRVAQYITTTMVLNSRRTRESTGPGVFPIRDFFLVPFALQNRQSWILGKPRIHSRQLAQIKHRSPIRRDSADVLASFTESDGRVSQDQVIARLVRLVLD